MEHSELAENEDIPPMDTIPMNLPEYALGRRPKQFEEACVKLGEEISPESFVPPQIADSSYLEKSEPKVPMPPAVQLPPSTFPTGEDNESQLSVLSWTSSEINEFVEKNTNFVTSEKYEDNLRNDVPPDAERAMEKSLADVRSFKAIPNTQKFLLTITEIESGAFTADSNAAEQFEHTPEYMGPKTPAKPLASNVLQTSFQTTMTTAGRENPGSSQFSSTMEIDDDNAGTSTAVSFNLDSRPQLKINKEQTWGLAHDAIRSDDGLLRKALCVCRILFNDVMTEDDILNRSRRAQRIGEGNKRRRTEPFQPEKLDFIREACAFILSTPEKKYVGTDLFERARKDNSFKSLDTELWEKLATPLLGKHASVERKKLEKSQHFKNKEGI